MSSRGRVILALGLVLGAACGDSSSSTHVASGGIGGTGISSGSVTGFGSYFVTGTEWSLAATGVVEIDGATYGPGRPYDERDLSLGMYLRVEGERSADGATATSTFIRYDEAIRGAVEQAPFDVSSDAKQFTILGQHVVIHEGLTVFEGTSFDTLERHDVIEVSGPLDSDGGILATRVERRGTLDPGQTEIEFKGEVSSLAEQSFSIGDASVRFDCAGPTDCTALPGEAFADGQLVEVEGIQNTAGVTPEIDALVIRPFTPFASAVGDARNLEVEGVIDDFMGLSSFTVNGVAVDASSARRDPDGPILYGDGVYVEVEGDRSDGILRARELFLRQGAARVSARIASGGLDRVGEGEIVLLAEGDPGDASPRELVVAADGSTRLEDRSSIGAPDLGLDDLLVGDFLEVRGVVLGPGRLRATEIRREEVAGDVRLRGRVESVDRDTSDGTVGYTALGIFVELVQGTTSVPGGDVEAFLAGVAVGDLLDARDEVDGSEETFDIADEVVIE